MNIYKNKRRGFSLVGALVGVAVGVAIVAVTGALAAPVAMGPTGVIAALPVGGSVAGASAGIGTSAYLAGGAIGGIVGGIFGPDSSSSSTPPASTNPLDPGASLGPVVDCSAVQNAFSYEQNQFTASQSLLSQAQANLNAANQNATSSTNNYNNNFAACTNPSTTSITPCGQSNNGNCSAQQNDCNSVAAQVAATNQAACQLETQALAIQAGGTASSTANPAANVFTLGLNPSTVAAGGTTSIVTTISISNIASQAIKSFSILILDSNNNVVGNIVSNATVNVAAAQQVSLQYNYQLPTSMTAGTYTVEIYNDANSNENTKTTLTVTGTGSNSSNFSAAGSSGAFNITINPSTLHPGTPFTAQITVNSADVRSYSVYALQNGTNLGEFVSGIPVNTAALPATSQQTITTSSSIPPGTYQIEVMNDGNSNEYQSTPLTVVSGTGAIGTGFFGTSGSSGTSVSGSYYGNTANICSLSGDLSVGSTDAATGGAVTALQNFLTAKGLYTYQVTGYFGSITKAAVQQFQAANGVSPTGYVGPLTRAAIENGSPCN